MPTESLIRKTSQYLEENGVEVMPGEHRIVVKSWEVLSCVCVPGVTFAFDKSFIRATVVEKMKELESALEEHPDGKVMIFGHTDKVGSEAYNKSLSERRAKSAFAFITNNTDIWEKLYEEENWGLAVIQEILLDLGFDPGPIDGKDGMKTQWAVEEFQASMSLKKTGVVDKETRKYIFIEYFSGKHDIVISPEQFLDPKHTGCGEFNPVVETDEAFEPNRRVSFFIFDPKRLPEIPCKDGDLSPCKQMIAVKGAHHKASFKCAFFDNIAADCRCEGGDKPDVSPLQFLFPVKESTAHKQYVNLAADAKDGSMGNELRIRVTLKDGKEGQKVYWRVRADNNNSARTEPKKGLKHPDSKDFKELAAGTGMGDLKQAESSQGAKDLEAKHISQIKSGTSEMILCCGVAGGDRFTVETGLEEGKWTNQIEIVNWRRLEFETIQPLADGPDQLTDYTVFTVDKSPGLSDASKEYLDKVLGKGFVEFDQKYGDNFNKTDLSSHGQFNIFDGAYAGKAAGEKFLVLSFDQAEKILKTKAKYKTDPRTISIVWCDYLADMVKWPESFTGIFKEGDFTSVFSIFERAIDATPGYNQGDYAIKSLSWQASHWFNTAGGKKEWVPITSSADPGWNFRSGGTFSTEAEIKDHVSFKGIKTISFKFPNTKAHYPGKLIPKINGQFEDNGVVIGLTLNIKGVACETNTNGAAVGGNIWMNTFAGLVNDIGMASVIAHELGHNMGQAYANKSVDATFGRPNAKPIPGIPFPVGIPLGDVYGGQGHRGTHCAKGLKDKTGVSFQTQTAYKERTCVMFGGSDMGDSTEYYFCPDCISYVKSETLEDIRRSWRS